MWWDEQTPKMKEKVRVLVDEGRLEFIGGAWSMNVKISEHLFEQKTYLLIHRMKLEFITIV